MLNDKDIKQIQEFLDTKEEGGYFLRRQQRKIKRELITELEDLEVARVDLLKAKIRNETNKTRKAIKTINIDTINHSAKDEDIKNIPEIESNETPKETFIPTSSRFFK